MYGKLHMTYPEAIAIVGGSTVSVVGICYILVRLLRRGTNGDRPLCPIEAGDGIDRLIAAVDRMAAVLADVRDKLVYANFQGEAHTSSLLRVEGKVDALHRRIPGGRE